MNNKNILTKEEVKELHFILSHYPLLLEQGLYTTPADRIILDQTEIQLDNLKSRCKKIQKKLIAIMNT
jgi:hypothetical protein